MLGSRLFLTQSGKFLFVTRKLLFELNFLLLVYLELVRIHAPHSKPLFDKAVQLLLRLPLARLYAEAFVLAVGVYLFRHLADAFAVGGVRRFIERDSRPDVLLNNIEYRLHGRGFFGAGGAGFVRAAEVAVIRPGTAFDVARTHGVSAGATSHIAATQRVFAPRIELARLRFHSLLDVLTLIPVGFAYGRNEKRIELAEVYFPEAGFSYAVVHWIAKERSHPLNENGFAAAGLVALAVKGAVFDFCVLSAL